MNDYEQRKIIEEQDNDLDNLSKTMSTIKDLAVNIDQELTAQDRLLKALSDDVDKSLGSVKKETRQVEKLSGTGPKGSKTNTCNLL